MSVRTERSANKNKEDKYQNKKQGVAVSLKTTVTVKLILEVKTESVGNSEERIWLAKYRRQVAASLGSALKPQ